MAGVPAFQYAPMFQLGKDTTGYRLISKDYVSVGDFEGTPILKVAPEGIRTLIAAAFHEVNFLLRRSHNEQVAAILTDPEATENDKFVAL
ncbi:MAG TPA: fumarate hydratase, partial [Sutterella sp.]|nr:fumarate hydratase [Sutterella sp.]